MPHAPAPTKRSWRPRSRRTRTGFRLDCGAPARLQDTHHDQGLGRHHGRPRRRVPAARAAGRGLGSGLAPPPTPCGARRRSVSFLVRSCRANPVRCRLLLSW